MAVTPEQAKALAQAAARRRRAEAEQQQQTEQPTTKTESALKQFLAKHATGITQLATNPIASGAEALGEIGTGMVAGPLSGLAGIMAKPAKLFAQPFGEGADFASSDAVRSVSDKLTYRPRTEGGKLASEIVNAPFTGLNYLGERAGEASQPYVGTLGATAVETGIKALPLLLGARGRGRGARAEPRPTSEPIRPPMKAPSAENLKTAADIAYSVADNSGTAVSKQSFGKLVDDIRSTLADKAVDETLHPDTLAAFRRLEQAAKDPATQGITLKGLDTLRQVVNDARQGLPRDSSKASAMLDKLDDYMENLSQADLISGGPEAAQTLSTARNLWSRYRKGEEIAKLSKNAEIAAGGYSNAGFENALRIEFKKLALNERRMRRFTKEEQEAIRNAAKVDAGDFALRLLGKLATRGTASAIPTILASAAGGPAAGLAVMAGGELGYLGSRMRRVGKANAAEELMRRGPQNSLATKPPRNSLVPRE